MDLTVFRYSVYLLELEYPDIEVNIYNIVFKNNDGDSSEYWIFP